MSVKVEIWVGLKGLSVFMVNAHRSAHIHTETGGQKEQESRG